MLPVAIAMLGSGAKSPTVGFLGWLGPRGLASIVFAVLPVRQAQLAGVDTILRATYLTVGLSVFAHGIEPPSSSGSRVFVSSPVPARWSSGTVAHDAMRDLERPVRGQLVHVRRGLGLFR